MTVFGMYFPSEVIFVFVSTLAAILLTHLAICIVFGFFDLQKYSMSWLLPVSLAACVLYIPSLLAEPMVLLLYFALAVFFGREIHRPKKDSRKVPRSRHVEDIPSRSTWWNKLCSWSSECGTHYHAGELWHGPIRENLCRG